MGDDTVAYDGTPLQSGMAEQQLTGRDPGYSIAGLREMVVIARYFVGEPGNRSRSYVEYACRDIKSGDVIPGCRRLDVMNGLDNGDDNVLHPATKLRPGAPGKLSRQTPANDTDGDRVLVGFVEGSRNRAVIIGVLRGPGTTYGATPLDGERRLTKHQGTTVEIKSDGTYVITGVKTTEVEGVEVKLGKDATQHAVRAEDLNANVLQPIATAATTLETTLTTATTPAQIIAGLNVFLESLKAAVNAFSTAVSVKVKVE